MSGPAGWYREWFGPAYLALYPHRDRAEAEAGVRLFLDAAAPPEGTRVLDLACGAGRHLGPLRATGHPTVGADLSRALLEEARENAPADVPLVRADMRRLPFAADAFGGVTSFFTSFGYFESADEDRRVAREIARVARAGGSFLLDYLNAPRVRETLVPSDERNVEGRHVRQTRWIEEGRVMKRIEIHSSEGGAPEVHYERVRLYEPAELERLLEGEDLRVSARFGGYDGRGHSRSSARLILVGRVR